eukprot:3939147-Rhodomonas_salina.1
MGEFDGTSVDPSLSAPACRAAATAPWRRWARSIKGSILPRVTWGDTPRAIPIWRAGRGEAPSPGGRRTRRKGEDGPGFRRAPQVRGVFCRSVHLLC